MYELGISVLQCPFCRAFPSEEDLHSAVSFLLGSKDHLWENGGNWRNSIQPVSRLHRPPPMKHRPQYGQKTMKHKIPSPYVPYNNYPLEKNPTAELGIKPGTSWSVTNDVTIKSSGWTKINMFLKTSHISFYYIARLQCLFSTGELFDGMYGLGFSVFQWTLLSSEDTLGLITGLRRSSNYIRAPLCVPLKQLNYD